MEGKLSEIKLTNFAYILSNGRKEFNSKKGW